MNKATEKLLQIVFQHRKKYKKRDYTAIRKLIKEQVRDVSSYWMKKEVIDYTRKKQPFMQIEDHLRRAAFVLFIAQFKYNEISNMTGKSIRTIKKWIREGKEEYNLE